MGVENRIPEEYTSPSKEAKSEKAKDLDVVMPTLEELNGKPAVVRDIKSGKKHSTEGKTDELRMKQKAEDQAKEEARLRSVIDKLIMPGGKETRGEQRNRLAQEKAAEAEKLARQKMKEEAEQKAQEQTEKENKQKARDAEAIKRFSEAVNAKKAAELKKQEEKNAKAEAEKLAQEAEKARAEEEKIAQEKTRIENEQKKKIETAKKRAEMLSKNKEAVQKLEAFQKSKIPLTEEEKSKKFSEKLDENLAEKRKQQEIEPTAAFEELVVKPLRESESAKTTETKTPEAPKQETKKERVVKVKTVDVMKFINDTPLNEDYKDIILADDKFLDQLQRYDYKSTIADFKKMVFEKINILEDKLNLTDEGKVKGFDLFGFKKRKMEKDPEYKKYKAYKDLQESLIVSASKRKSHAGEKPNYERWVVR